MGATDDRPTTRLQVSGYRFLIRRAQHALVRGDVRMIDDPQRAQSLSLAAGTVLAVIMIAGCAILAFLRPQGTLGSAAIVTVRESGALYVRVDDTVHPVPNLASARLIAGTAADPTVVSAKAIEAARRGPLLGIAGAPASIGAPLAPTESNWTVCDTPDRTAVLAARPDEQRRRFESGEAMLVAARGESAATTYLLYDGRRAIVDLRDRVVTSALRLDGHRPRQVSRSLLDAIPEAPPIVVPAIAEVGSPGPATLGDYPVGTVLRSERADATEFHVVLADGVQRIGEVTADLIRLSVRQPRADIPAVAGTALAATPSVEQLPVATHPAHVAVVDHPVLCARWRPGAVGQQARVDLMGTDSLSTDSTLVALAQADGAGPNVDAVGLPAGRSAFVRAVGVGGSGGEAGPLYVVTDLGVVFGLPDEQSAHHLGLSGTAVPAPWPVLARLPRGPELNRERASVLRDTAPPAGAPG
jgi:type VII secretion protein EccB